jgi:hypothetical protein
MHRCKGVSVLYITLLLAAFVLPQSAHAGFVLGVGGDATNFAVLYEGNGQQMQFNNSFLTGNIGIGAVNGTTGSFQGNGPGTITGNIEFDTANTGQFSNSGLTITGSVTYSNSNVDADLAAMTGLNQLSKNLGLETGTSTTISTGGSINASNGILDGSGNRVFTVSSIGFPNGTFTINGSASDYVVLNVAGNVGSNGLNGSIVLAGGITSDHVLINYTPATSNLTNYNNDYTNLTGAPTLTISTNGATTTGTFLDPAGNIQINHSVLDGRLFGGDTQNLSIVSGATIVAPPSPTPEPAHTAFALALMLGIALAARKKLIRS